jgi:hypothetical protein
MELRTLLIYMPQTWPTISTRVFKSFLELVSPDNLKEYEKRGYQVKTLISGTFPLDRNRNEAVDLAISGKYSANLIMFIDGDNILPKNAIVSLIDEISDEYPVVSGLYWRKSAPYACVQGHYGKNEKQKDRMETIKSMGFVDEKTGQQLLFYTPLKDFTTQQTIDVSGMGCLLAKAEVFKKLDLPYFSYHNSYSLGGDFSITHSSEEMTYFMKLHKQGIKTLLVPSVKCGHEVYHVIGNPEGD